MTITAHTFTRVRFLLAALLTVVAVRAQSVTIGVSAGKLYTREGTALPAGNLVLLVADTSGNGFGALTAGHSLTVGSMLNADDQILGRLFTDADSMASLQFPNIPLASNPTPGPFTALTSGDALAVVWFSSLTSVSSVLTAGNDYGLFSSMVSTIDGDDWSIPSSGLITIHFLTQQGDPIDGTHLEAEARAVLTVTAVPEPATYAAGLAFFALGFAAFRRRRRQTVGA